MRHTERSAGQASHATGACGDPEQELSVVGRCRASAQDRIVARTFLQATNALGCDPDERVVPIQSARKSRDEIAQGVSTFDMCELVHESRVTRRFTPCVAARR